MLRCAVVVAMLVCAVDGRLRQPAIDDQKMEVAELKASPVFKKVADEMKLVAKALERGTKNQTAAKEALKTVEGEVSSVKKEMESVKKDFEAAEKDKKFPWWANASAGSVANFSQVKKAPAKDKKIPWTADVAGQVMPNLTQVKTEKAPAKDKKIPWTADVAGQVMPNLTQVKTEKAPAKDKKIPWTADVAGQVMPNLTQVKTEKAPAKKDADKKMPWWSAPTTDVANLTQVKTQKVIEEIIKGLPTNISKGQPTFADLGPFDSKEAACDYCFTSHTRTSVVPNCICTAYNDGGWTMFCTASAAGVKYVADKGGCKCVENNQAAMGKTTCDPF